MCLKGEDTAMIRQEWRRLLHNKVCLLYTSSVRCSFWYEEPLLGADWGDSLVSESGLLKFQSIFGDLSVAQAAPPLAGRGQRETGF